MTQPDWVGQVDPNQSVHNPPARSPATQPFTQQQAQAYWTAFTDEMLAQVLLAVANVIGPAASAFLGLNTWATLLEQKAQDALTGANTANDSWTTFLESIGLSATDIAGLASWWNGLMGWLSGTNTIPSLTGSISAPVVANTLHSAQPVPNFPNAASLIGVSYAGGGWSWDPTVTFAESSGASSGGSAKCTANGMLWAQNGVVTKVQPGQTVSLAPQAKWSALSAASGTSPIQAQLVTWSGTTSPGTASPPILLAEITSPVTAETTWTALARATNTGTGVEDGVYTVPDTGVGFVQARIVVTADAASGQVWWNACDTLISGGYIASIDAGVSRLQDDAAASQTANVTLLQAIKTAWANDVGNGAQFLKDLSAAFSTWWTTQTNLAEDETVTLEQILDLGLGIDPLSGLTSASYVQGVGGLQTLETTFVTMWNQGIEAIQADLSAVGLSGFAQSLSGLSVQANNTQSTALSLAAIQAIVNKQPVSAGLEATVESNGDFHQAAALSGALVAQTTSRGSFITVSQAKTLGFIQWLGAYSSTPTAFVINFYKMDGSGNLVLLFSSPDLAATISSSVAWYVWDIPTANQIAVHAGDTIAVEFEIKTSGSVDAYGYTSPVAASHPSAAVKQLGFSQNWAGAAASTISAASIGWSQYAPYVGLGVGTPPPTPFFPQSIPFYTSSTHTPPSWANYVDLVGVGGGGGGEGETGAGNGPGGLGGQWNGATLTVGVTNTVHAGMDIPIGGTITITIGAGGAGGAYFTPGSDGAATTFAWTNMAGTAKTLTCPGGFGGSLAVNISSWGLSPGNYTYTTTAPSAQSTPYIGGATNALGEVGNTPGGGGPGGQAFQYGWAGGTGQAWTVDRQT